MQKIRELRLAKPFRPYQLTLKDGQKLTITERLGLGISHECTRATTNDDHGRLVMIWPGDVVSVEPLEPVKN